MVLTTKAGVDKDAINSKIVEDVSVAASLRNSRQDKTVSGLMVDASSTETFKTFYITGGGAKDAAVTATGNVNYLGGKTETKVQSSNLNAGSGALMVGASDAANVDTVIATASGALGAAIGVVTNIITTDHSTGVVVTGTSTDKSSLTGTSVSVDADAKEGISSLLIAASGAQYAAVSASVNVNRQLSDVSAAVDQTEVLGSFAQNANYLGRITTSAITAAGSQYAAVPISVVINYADNAVSSSVAHSILRAEGQSASVGANRISEFSSLNVTASGAMYGAAAGLVNVNTIEGATSAEVNDSQVKAGQFSVNAENEDHLKVTDVTATGAIGSLGASVVVSYLKGSSVANLRNSTVTADNLTVSSLQNHFVKGTVAFASGGLGTIGANVFSLVIGSGDNPFASNRQDLGSAEDTVNKYLSNYASSGSGSLGFINESKDLTQEEKEMYTTVLKGHIQLETARFLQGCSGQSLDILARTPLWEKGFDYNHGTGHGVGYLLSVHEGPNSFRYRPSVNGRNDCILEEGMITSDEPGIYLEGKFGIRLENMIVCQKDVENEYGSFLCFDSLTLVPFDLSAIILEELSTKERRWLEQYHKKVFETIAPYLTEEETEWLKETLI